MDLTRKAEGFENQYLFVIHEDFCQSLAKQALFAPFYVSDIGYFPHAQYHYRKRTADHSQAILLLCTAGKGFFSIDNGAQNSLSAGQAIVLPPHSSHEYAAATEDPWTIYWLHFEGSQAMDFCGILQQYQPFFVEAEIQQELLRLFHFCFEILKKPYQSEEYHVVCQNAATILSLLCLAGKRASTQASVKGSTAIQSAIEFMKQNLHTNISLSDLAQAANFSHSHLSVLFKSSSGYAPIDYFLRMKMQAASKELFFTDLPIKEIAAQFGIDDPCYFSRIFKKSTGMSPLAYRKQMKG